MIFSPGILSTFGSYEEDVDLLKPRVVEQTANL